MIEIYAFINKIFLLLLYLLKTEIGSTLISLLNCASGTSALTLAAGTAGQIKILSMIDATNAAELTTSNGNLLAAQVSTKILFNSEP